MRTALEEVAHYLKELKNLAIEDKMHFAVVNTLDMVDKVVVKFSKQEKEQFIGGVNIGSNNPGIAGEEVYKLMFKKD